MQNLKKDNQNCTKFKLLFSAKRKLIIFNKIKYLRKIADIFSKIKHVVCQKCKCKQIKDISLLPLNVTYEKHL